MATIRLNHKDNSITVKQTSNKISLKQTTNKISFHQTGKPGVPGANGKPGVVESTSAPDIDTLWFDPNDDLPSDDLVSKDQLSKVAFSGSFSDLYDVPVSIGSTTSNQDLSDYVTNEILTTDLAEKANIAHTHSISDITDLQGDLEAKQDALVSGTTIKTVNSESILGEGDITISTGGGGLQLVASGDLSNAVDDFYDISGLNGDVDGVYELHCVVAGNSNIPILIRLNNDGATTTPYRTIISDDSYHNDTLAYTNGQTSQTGLGLNGGIYLANFGNVKRFKATIYAKSGTVRNVTIHCTGFSTTSNDISRYLMDIFWTNTTDNLTRLRVWTLGTPIIYSNFQLYKYQQS